MNLLFTISELLAHNGCLCLPFLRSHIHSLISRRKMNTEYQMPVAELQQVAFLWSLRSPICSNKLVDLEIYYHWLESAKSKSIFAYHFYLVWLNGISVCYLFAHRNFRIEWILCFTVRKFKMRARLFSGFIMNKGKYLRSGLKGVKMTSRGSFKKTLCFSFCAHKRAIA